MRASIIKIGNSKGIRLPKSILEELSFGEEVELESKGTHLEIRPVKKNPREGWAEALAAIPESEKGLVWPEFGNEWDEKEWTW